MRSVGERADHLGRDVDEPGSAVGFRQELATAGPGRPLTINTAMKGNPVVKTATTDMPINASDEVRIRAEALHAAYNAAIEQCARESTSDNERNVAAVGRDLAEVYHELAREFCDSAVLFHALYRAGDHLIAEAKEYDQRATEREYHAAVRGDAR